MSLPRVGERVGRKGLKDSMYMGAIALQYAHKNRKLYIDVHSCIMSAPEKAASFCSIRT